MSKKKIEDSEDQDWKDYLKDKSPENMQNSIEYLDQMARYLKAHDKYKSQKFPIVDFPRNSEGYVKLDLFFEALPKAFEKLINEAPNRKIALNSCLKVCDIRLAEINRLIRDPHIAEADRKLLEYEIYGWEGTKIVLSFFNEGTTTQQSIKYLSLKEAFKDGGFETFLYCLKEMDAIDENNNLNLKTKKLLFVALIDAMGSNYIHRDAISPDKISTLLSDGTIKGLKISASTFKSNNTATSKTFEKLKLDFKLIIQSRK